jgi:nucleoside-diphosphate-sugar epimerase
MALDSDFAGAFNVASGSCVALRAVVERLGALIGRPELIEFGARAAADDEPAQLAATTSLLKQRIGFAPRYDLAQGLASTVQWWQSRTGAL